VTRLSKGASHKNPAGIPVSDLDGRPRVEVGEVDRLLAALIEQHGPSGRPDIYGDESPLRI